MTFMMVEAKTQNFGSVLDVETTICFLDFQDNNECLKKMQKPIILHLSYRLDVKSTSFYA